MTAISTLTLILLCFPPPTPTGVDLAPPHVDASFGFSIQPPRDWLVHAERTANPQDTLLFQTIDSAPAAFPPDITVKLVAAPRGSTIDRIIADIRFRLAEDFKDLQE